MKIPYNLHLLPLILMVLWPQTARAQLNSDHRFKQALSIVYQRHPELLAGREEVKIQEEEVANAFSGFRPNVSANYGYGRQRRKVSNQQWQYGEARGGSLIAEQELFNGFGTLSSWRAEKKRLLAAQAKLLDLEQSILLEATQAWIELGEGNLIRANLTNNIKQLQNYLVATQSRFDAGGATLTDISLATSRLSNAEAGFATAEGNFHAARVAFERIFGAGSASEILSLASPYPPVPVKLPANEELAADHARNSPMLTEIMQLEEASEQDIDATRANRYPRVTLRGSMSESRSPELGLSRLRSDSLTLNINVPLYQSGAEYSRLRQAKAVRNKIRYDAIDLTQKATERAQRSWHNYRAARIRVRAAHKAMNAASKALHGIDSEQREGLRSLLDVLNAQQESMNATISEIQAHAILRLEAYQLLASLGELTAESLELDTPNAGPAANQGGIFTTMLGVKEF